MVPMSTSAWPPMYLVAELVTKSAPSKMGDYNTGLQKVLSTQVIASCLVAISQIFLMSHIFRVGLVGVSIQIAFVLGLMVLSTVSRLHMSMKSTSKPKFLIAIYRKYL